MCGHGEHKIHREREPRQIGSDELSPLLPWAHTGCAQRRDEKEDLGSTSRGTPRVAMVQTADLRNRNDFAQ